MKFLRQYIEQNEHSIIKEMDRQIEVFKRSEFIHDTEGSSMKFATCVNKFIIDYIEKLDTNPENNDNEYYIHTASILIAESKNLCLDKDEPENIILVLKALRKAYEIIFHEEKEVGKYRIYIEDFIDIIELYIIRLWKDVKTEETRRNENKFLKLNETIPIGIQVLVGGKSRYMNSYMKIITGYSEEELSNITFFNIIQPEYFEAAREKIMDCKQGENYIINFETKIICRDGREKWVDLRIDNTVMSGEVCSIVCMNDITLHKELEEALRQREEQLLLLFDSIPGAIIFKDGSGKWLHLNKFAVELMGIEGIDYVGKYTNEISGMSNKFKKTFPLSEETDEKAWKDKMTLHMNQTMKSADGGRIELEINKIPVFNGDGTRKGMLTLAFDVTERKMVEELSEKIKESAREFEKAIEYEKIKIEFFANISHELRTPINVIFSAIQLFDVLIPDDQLEPKNNAVRKYLKIMEQNCFRLVKLINNLIDITKIDAGYYEVSLKNCDIISIVEDTTMSVVEYAGLKGINIVFDTDVEEMIMACDADKIERIMLNMLSNAVKFTSDGGSIEVNIHHEEHNIAISVKDSGIGIPREKQHMIFERFTQVDKSLSRSCEGSGIGLSIVKSFVSMHGGTISLKSESGRGSEFIIKLPIVLLEETDEMKNENCFVKNKADTVSIEFSDIYS